MYVCNGRIDCSDGYDEKVCACKNQRKIIIMTPGTNDDTRFLEIAARLGGLLFTEKSEVKVVKYEPIATNFQRLEKSSSKPIITFHISDILSNSEHYRKPFKRKDLTEQGIKYFLEDFYEDVNEHVTFGIILLTDENTETYLESVIFQQLDQMEKGSLKTVFKYHVVIDRNAKTEISHINKGIVREINVRNADILGTIGNQIFPELCDGTTLPCHGRYRCLLSKVCIPLNQVCNNRKECPYGDDEDNCNFQCPKSCSCGSLIINCSNMETTNVTLSGLIPARVLDLSNSTYICTDFLERDSIRRSFTFLISLNMSYCNIKTLSSYTFSGLNNLKTLDLSFNTFTKLPTNVFDQLKVLKHLILTGNNQLMEIEPGALYGISLNNLTVSYTKIHTLSADMFKGLCLDYLDLSHNEITDVQDFAFNSLESNTIDIRENPITTFAGKMFSGIINVQKLKTPAFKFCCIRPSSLKEEDCLPYKDEFSSCEDLMRNGTLQALMWTIGILALLGNILSLVYRLLYDRKRLKLGYGLFVTNLAIADLFMGVYMLIIAVADKSFRNRYIEVDEYWRNSVWCRLAGVLSTVSSEASVLFMCLITIDRILVIKYPFGQLRFNVKSATCAAIATWIFALIISLLPVIYTGYFEGQFYSKSAVCLALPLTRQRPPGWLYSILLFIGFNMFTFILIAVGQLLIYAEIKKQASLRKSLNSTRTNDLKVARNLLLLVTTDFMCWFPIGMMGVLALAGHTIPGEVYAWTAVIILPINSALNPFMYTLTAIYSRQKFSPSVEEQSRTDMFKEMGKIVLKIYPYVPTYKQKKNSTILSLRDVMKNRSLTPLETAHLIFRILSFIGILHEHGLGLKQITEDDIFVAVLDNGLIKRKIQIDVRAYPNTSTKKNVNDDMYSFGCLLERILRKSTIPKGGRSADT
ncbi:G-protein coupled receptor GRL101-like [Mercenaria mercenaria]|uniref:G-protein coupled receptor GRL101-like n=1 Tax=Mercenaria mercenaria TaxID=6596 RepID=UPI00234E9905|nr:G-protein coupled receptor GRL101-like [Mercenaria mercenaria]XP_053375485.1 G-protein coupled receptor GRL101-like [Mercenaria mercenaria]